MAAGSSTCLRRVSRAIEDVRTMATKKATLQQIRDAWNQWEADRKMAWQVLVEIGDILEADEEEALGLSITPC